MSTTSKKKKTTSKKDESLVAEEDILMAAVDDEAPEVSIEDLPGVGPATAEKLREAGFDELLALAVMSPGDLADQAELGEAVAGKIINAAKKMANIGGFVSGVALLDRRREVQKLSSKVQSIDDLLGGGFETQALVEVYGAFGSGKTQIGHQLAVNCTMSVEDGGFDGDVFYIDTEDTIKSIKKICDEYSNGGLKYLSEQYANDDSIFDDYDCLKTIMKTVIEKNKVSV